MSLAPLSIQIVPCPIFRATRAFDLTQGLMSPCSPLPSYAEPRAFDMSAHPQRHVALEIFYLGEGAGISHVIIRR